MAWLGDTVFGWFFNSSSEAIVNILDTISNPPPIELSMDRFSDTYYSNWGIAMQISTAAAAVLLVIMIVMMGQGTDKLIKRGGRALGFIKVWFAGIFAYPIVDFMIDGRDAIIGGVIEANLPSLRNAVDNQQAFAAMFGVNDWIGAIVVTVLGKPLLWMLEFSELSLRWMIAAITLFMALSILGGVFEVVWKAFQAMFWTFFLAPFIIAVTLTIGVALQLLTVPIAGGITLGIVDGTDAFIGVIAIMLAFALVIGLFFAFFQTEAFRMGSLNATLMVTPGSITASGGSSSLTSGVRKVGSNAAHAAKGAATSAMKHVGDAASRFSGSTTETSSPDSIADKAPQSDDVRVPDNASKPARKKPSTGPAYEVGKDMVAAGHPVPGLALMAGSVATVGVKKVAGGIADSVTPDTTPDPDTTKEVS